MNRFIIGALKSLVVLCLYITVIIAVAPVLHIVFLVGLLAWIVFRSPITHPDRINADVSMFAQKVGHVMGKAMETLIRPLVDNS